MKKKLLNTFLLSLVFVLIGSISYFTIDSNNENKQIQNKINQFKSNASFYYHSDYYSTDFYRVKSSNTPCFTIKENTIYPGYNGDILATLYNEMEIDIVSDVFSYYFGGHVALVVEGDKLFQTTGKDSNDANKSDYVNNNWLHDNTLRSSFIGLRVNVDQTTRDNVVNHSKDYLNIPYNYSFIFNRKRSYYCTDLIQCLYEEYSDVSLKQNSIIVSVQDIILSEDVYIFMYKEKDENGNYKIYYLDDGIDYKEFLEI